MEQKIIFRNNTLGSINVVVKPAFSPNSFEIGNKIFDFSLIVPTGMDIRNEDFNIVIFDGVYVHCHITIGTDTYIGRIGLYHVKTEKLLVSSI